MPAFDVVAIGAHPDDVEASCGGLLAKLVARGHQVAVCDLTRGELGSNGSPEARAVEAAAAARVLGITTRVGLDLPDGGLDGRDPAQTTAVVRMLRELRPRLVVAPQARARHPDHVEAARLVRRAHFFAAVHRFVADAPAIARPTLIHGLDYDPMRESFVVDVSAWMEIKLAALRCYASQFDRTAGARPTLLNDPAYLERIRMHARWYGDRIGCEAGEPFTYAAGIPVDDPVAILAREAGT